MSRFVTYSYTSGSVSANSSLTENKTGLPTLFNILKVKVTPNTAGGTTRVEMYRKDTFLSADLCFVTGPFSTSFISPIQADTATERKEGFVLPYEDDDLTGEMHVKIYNDDSTAKTYAVEITYEELPMVAYKTANTGSLIATLANDAHMVLNVRAGGYYRIRAHIFWSAAGATAGAKVAIGGTATVTELKAQITQLDDSANSIVSARVTALGSSVGADDTGDNVTIVEGAMKINAAGTILIQRSQNSTDGANATSFQLGSYMELLPAAVAIP